MMPDGEDLVADQAKAHPCTFCKLIILPNCLCIHLQISATNSNASEVIYVKAHPGMPLGGPSSDVAPLKELVLSGSACVRAV